MTIDLTEKPAIKTTPLYDLHLELGAKMVNFVGYSMPVYYPAGILHEHLHVRKHAGLFDVSHMGQVQLSGGEAVAALETLVPGDIVGLKNRHTRYTQFTTETGGIIDDLMVTKLADDRLGLVVNAGCKVGDLAHLRAHMNSGVVIEYLVNQALLALQGPDAAAVLAPHVPGIETLPFMTGMATPLFGAATYITRSGYTGEDGFEISLAAEDATPVARHLLADARVQPIGLGARDSLRLEAGLCLYGHDINLGTTPIEAGLAWSIGKRRREHGGFKGEGAIREQLANGSARRRVGIMPGGRTPAREGSEILDLEGEIIGMVTSGGFSPTLDRPIAMGYVPADLAHDGSAIQLLVRGRPLPAHIVNLPFVPTNYYRKST